jgi:hypothetical protein
MFQTDKDLTRVEALHVREGGEATNTTESWPCQAPSYCHEPDEWPAVVQRERAYLPRAEARSYTIYPYQSGVMYAPASIRLPSRFRGRILLLAFAFSRHSWGI